MRNYFFIAVLGLMFVCSCNSEPEKKEKTKKIEVDAQFAKFLAKFAKSPLPYKKNPKGDEKYAKISLDEQIKYLQKAEDLSAEELKEMQEYTDFYFVSNPINTDKYHAIIYGRFEMGSVYYFLCTYNNKGKLISHIDFAAYEMMSAGPQAGQEFYTKGEISDNKHVVVATEEGANKYTITENGKIVPN